VSALALAAVLLAPLAARAEEPASALRGGFIAKEPAGALRGGWIAKAGAAVFRGRWSGRFSSNPATDAQGSWTLLGEGDAIVLEGTWGARRDGRKWQGAWTARTAAGAVFSGTWQTRMANIKGRTFFDLLLHAKTTRVAGTWRMGRGRGVMNGDFWLESS